MNWLEERQTRKALTRIACAGSARQYLMIKNPKACIAAMGLDMLKEIKRNNSGQKN